LLTDGMLNLYGMADSKQKPSYAVFLHSDPTMKIHWLTMQNDVATIGMCRTYQMLKMHIFGDRTVCFPPIAPVLYKMSDYAQIWMISIRYRKTTEKGSGLQLLFSRLSNFLPAEQESHSLFNPRFRGISNMEVLL